MDTNTTVTLGNGKAVHYGEAGSSMTACGRRSQGRGATMGRQGRCQAVNAEVTCKTCLKMTPAAPVEVAPEAPAAEVRDQPTSAGQEVWNARGQRGVTTEAPIRGRIAVQWIGADRAYPVIEDLADLTLTAPADPAPARRPGGLPVPEVETVKQTVVDCHYCNGTHPAERSGMTETFGVNPPRTRYAVVCDGYVDYYTDEVVYTRTVQVRPVNFDLS